MHISKENKNLFNINMKIFFTKILKIVFGIFGTTIGSLYIKFAQYLSNNWVIFDKDIESKYYYYQYDEFKQLIELNNNIGYSIIAISIIITIIIFFIKIGPEKVIINESIPSQIENYNNKIKENEDVIKMVSNISKGVSEQKIKDEIAETIEKLKYYNKKYNEHINQLEKYKYVIGVKAIYEVLEKGKINDAIINSIDNQNYEYCMSIEKRKVKKDDDIIKAYESLRIYAAKKIFKSISDIKLLSNDDLEEINNSLRIQINDLDYDIDKLNAEIEIV